MILIFPCDFYCLMLVYRAAVILDGWMFPIKSEPFLNIPQPMLFVNSQTFNLPPNISLLRKYFYSKGIRQLYTLKNTTHESPTDTPYIHGYWLDLLMLKKMDAKTALNLQSSLVVKFLRETVGTYLELRNDRVPTVYDV